MDGRDEREKVVFRERVEGFGERERRSKVGRERYWGYTSSGSGGGIG